MATALDGIDKMGKDAFGGLHKLGAHCLNIGGFHLATVTVATCVKSA